MYGLIAGRMDGTSHTFVLPPVGRWAAHLAPTLPWRDEAAMAQALAQLAWWGGACPERQAWVIGLPSGDRLIFERGRAREWVLRGALPTEAVALRQCALLARAYYVAYLTLEAQRYGWRMSEVMRQDGALEITYAAG